MLVLDSTTRMAPLDGSRQRPVLGTIGRCERVVLHGSATALFCRHLITGPRVAAIPRRVKKNDVFRNWDRRCSAQQPGDSESAAEYQRWRHSCGRQLPTPGGYCHPLVITPSHCAWMARGSGESVPLSPGVAVDRRRRHFTTRTNGAAASHGACVRI